MGGLGAPELLIILFILGTMVLPIWGIIDAAVRPDPAWTAIGQSKIVWILVMVFLWTLGAILYFILARPKLVAATTRP
jgi:hypothetical protein